MIATNGTGPQNYENKTKRKGPMHIVLRVLDTAGSALLGIGLFSRLVDSSALRQ